MWMEFVVDEMELCVAGQTWDDFGSLLYSSKLRTDCWQAGRLAHRSIRAGFQHIIRLLLFDETLFPRLCTCKENEPTYSGHPAIVRSCALSCAALPRAFVGSVVSPATMSHPHEVISIST